MKEIILRALAVFVSLSIPFCQNLMSMETAKLPDSMEIRMAKGEPVIVHENFADYQA